jgi:hypothetical protein
MPGTSVPPEMLSPAEFVLIFHVQCFTLTGKTARATLTAQRTITIDDAL